MKLQYTGPLKQCGFCGPVSGDRYLATAKPFEVNDADGDALLRKFPDVLAAVQPRKRKAADDGTNDNSDQPQS